MSLEARELYDSYEVSEGIDTSTVTRVFIVEGASLAVVNGPHLALLATGLPLLGEELGYEIGGAVLIVVKRNPKRYSPTSVKITVEYSSSTGGSTNPTEQERSQKYLVPYDEKVSISGHDELVQVDLDKRTIGDKAEGCNLQTLGLKWSFSVNVHPDDAFLLKFACFNEKRFFDLTQYDASQRAAIALKRPFSFPAGTLLYLGAEMGRTSLQYIEGQEWLWKADLVFLYDPRGWEFYKWHSTVEIPGNKRGSTLSTNYYYMDPFELGDDGKPGKETSYIIPSYKARVALYTKDSNGAKQFYWDSRVRSEADFTAIFPFRWDQ